MKHRLTGDAAQYHPPGKWDSAAVNLPVGSCLDHLSLYQQRSMQHRWKIAAEKAGGNVNVPLEQVPLEQVIMLVLFVAQQRIRPRTYSYDVPLAPFMWHTCGMWYMWHYIDQWCSTPGRGEAEPHAPHPRNVAGGPSPCNSSSSSSFPSSWSSQFPSSWPILALLLGSFAGGPSSWSSSESG